MKRDKIGNMPKRDHSVVLPDFFGAGENLEAWQLGWQLDCKREAKSSVSKKIFNYYIVEMGMNFVFYYVGDGNFYGIHTEICPTPVFRFSKQPAECVIDQLGYADTHDYYKNEVLYWADSWSDIWDMVKIDGKPLEEVLQNSYIVNIS